MSKLSSQLCIFFALTALCFSCTAVKEFHYNTNHSRLSESIDSIYSNIGLEVQRSRDEIFIDGPLNRNLTISIEKINEDSTALKFEAGGAVEFYIENMNSFLAFKLSNQSGRIIREKTKTTFTVLNMISPGIGWYYMTNNSAYWPQNNFSAALAFTMLDAILIYNAFSDKEKNASRVERAFNPFYNISKTELLLTALGFRLSCLVPGYYFLDYDNKMYKAGFSINF